jgi:hypothetical protein
MTPILHALARRDRREGDINIAPPPSPPPFIVCGGDLSKVNNEQPTKQTQAKEVKPEKGRIGMPYKKIISLLSVLAVVAATFSSGRIPAT